MSYRGTSLTFLCTKHRTHSDIMDLLTSNLGHTSTGVNIPVASHALLFQQNITQITLRGRRLIEET